MPRLRCLCQDSPVTGSATRRQIGFATALLPNHSEPRQREEHLRSKGDDPLASEENDLSHSVRLNSLLAFAVSVARCLRGDLLIVVIAALAAGCGDTSRAAAPPPAPVVRIEPVVERDVPITFEYVGTLVGYINAQIRARVSGHLVSQDYREGSLVKSGDLLFQVDPRPFQTAADQADARLQLAESQLSQAKAQVSASQAQVEQALATVVQAEAQVKRAEATQRQTELDVRSEEHTSELQSRPHLVCRRLLDN